MGSIFQIAVSSVGGRLPAFCRRGAARAETVLPAVLDRGGAAAEEKRAELQRTLEKNLPVLEAQSAVVKAAAKLIGPTTVHIKAEGPVHRSQYGGGQRSEEEGAGVIVEWKGRHYVLTNWHVVRAAAPEGIRINLADRRWLRPQRVLGDEDTDVAVLVIEGST